MTIDESVSYEVEHNDRDWPEAEDEDNIYALPDKCKDCPMLFKSCNVELCDEMEDAIIF